MNQLQLSGAILAAKKIFVWVEMSNKRAVYLQMTKSALYELLDGTADAGDRYNAFMENGELYIGAPPED